MTRRSASPPAWPDQPATELPSAAGCRTMLAQLDVSVPSRAEGRLSAHREGYAIVAALRWMAVRMPDLFPATLLRQEAPDFIIRPHGVRTAWALEHTDAGEQHYQKWLADTEGEDDAQLLPSPGDDGWVGDRPERAFEAALLAAVRRKSAPTFWRAAPSECVRCVLAYDQTNTRPFINNADAAAILRRVAAQAPAMVLMLVRGPDNVLVAGLPS